MAVVGTLNQVKTQIIIDCTCPILPATKHIDSVVDL